MPDHHQSPTRAWPRQWGASLMLVVFMVLATAPLLWRLIGIGAVIAERARTGSWPTDHDLIFGSGRFANWMYTSNLQSFVWFATLASPLAFLLWLQIVAGVSMPAPRFARIAQCVVAIWSASLVLAYVLGSLRLTGTF